MHAWRDASNGLERIAGIEQRLDVMFPDVKSFIKKHWILSLVVVLILAGITYAVHRTDPDIIALLSKYGYYGILIWTFLEGETIVIIAGLMAPKTGMDLQLIALCAFTGALLSDQLMFLIGKFKGEKVLHRFPGLAHRMEKATGLFKKYDTLLILSFRFIYGVRNITPIMLGISGVSYKKFFFLNIVGGALWATSFTYGGYYAGQTFLAVVAWVGHGIFYVIVGVLAVATLLWFTRSRIVVNRAVKFAKQQQELEHSGANENGHNHSPEAAKESGGAAASEPAGEKKPDRL